MTRDNKTEGEAEKKNDYAYWAIPGAAATVTYSLPLFHEIDFAVNEGYRKIPHGGIEEGGLLFGTIDSKGTRVDAFRPIVCEHASGPSFLLSDRDLQLMAEQIENAAVDPELEGLELVGWFLAHTRGPLILTDREADLCDQYFSRPGMVTVVVKPERFQPTRFGFLVRHADGKLVRDASQNAVILPLPGRSAKNSAGPVASIPAPTTTNVRRAPDADSAAPARDPAPPPGKTEVKTPPSAAAEIPPDRPARRQPRLNVERVMPRAGEEEDTQAGDDLPPAGKRSDMAQIARRSERDLEPVSRAGLVGAERTIAPRAVLHDDDDVDSLPDPYRQVELLNQKRPMSSTARMVLILPLAALLGCLMGWFAFKQIPSPIIPLTVIARGENLIVTWPAEQTRSAAYAAVRVDDSTPVMLTPEEKSSGRVEVQARPDMKVELIARNWIHDSRGIVHYIKPVANTAP